MSVQFGRWNLDGQPVEPGYLSKVRALLSSYGPDAGSSYTADGFAVIYQAFHTTKESHREKQPHLSPSGEVITWDGRLDNRREILRELNGFPSTGTTDIEIFAAAYGKWGLECFRELVGDWAVAVWNPIARSLLLAKDFVGTRHLYYSVEKDQITWSTLLDPLVLFARKPLLLCEEYLAGWLCSFPAPHLSPYVGIDSVPPCSLVRLGPGASWAKKYWDFDPRKTIRYATDAEYEEQFRTVFAEAVRRRLRSDSPVLAELSGGMDSSAIVCVADTVIARGSADTSRLDTISYFDDSEPNWNERPYFTTVEAKRGRIGCHIDVGSEESFTFEFGSNRFAATPGAIGSSHKIAAQIAEYLTSQGSRVVLSGTGGDEALGGVPTPGPELADLLARARVRLLARQLKAWALDKRRPWLHLLFEAARGFLPSALLQVPKHLRPAPWIHRDFIKRNRIAFDGYECRRRLFGILPSLQENLFTLNALRRQLACGSLSAELLYEKRYPYLDRSMLEFIYAVPREQLVRPGQRRSLMRRALVGIVPDEILNRKRKGFVTRRPLRAVYAEWHQLVTTTEHLLTASLGIVNDQILVKTLETARTGQAVPTVIMMRTIGLEYWLRQLQPLPFLQLSSSLDSHRMLWDRAKSEWTTEVRA